MLEIGKTYIMANGFEATIERYEPLQDLFYGITNMTDGIPKKLSMPCRWRPDGKHHEFMRSLGVWNTPEYDLILPAVSQYSYKSYLPKVVENVLALQYDGTDEMCEWLLRTNPFLVRHAMSDPNDPKSEYSKRKKYQDIDWEGYYITDKEYNNKTLLDITNMLILTKSPSSHTYHHILHRNDWLVNLGDNNYLCYYDYVFHNLYKLDMEE